MFCREQVTQLRGVQHEFEARDLHVVIVGSGQPMHAAAFEREESVPFTLRVDPELQAYAAAGLRRGVAKVFSPRAILHATRAVRGGFRQHSTQGDPWQNGGVFLIDPKGWVLFRQISHEAGDHASIPDLLAAADRGR